MPIQRTPMLPLPPTSSDSTAFQLREKTWVRAQTLRVMGVDPGWANMGIVVLEQTIGGPVKCLLAKHIKTESENKKAKIRVSVDDARRLKEIWYAIALAAEEAGPIQAISAEAYAPFKGRMGGNAWKSAMGYAVVHCYGFSQNILVHPGLPSDLKRGFGLSKSASKDEVGDALQAKIEGLREILYAPRKVGGSLLNIPEGSHEHVTDAAGHAFLGLMDIYKLRQQTGVIV